MRLLMRNLFLFTWPKGDLLKVNQKDETDKGRQIRLGKRFPLMAIINVSINFLYNESVLRCLFDDILIYVICQYSKYSFDG